MRWIAVLAVVLILLVCVTIRTAFHTPRRIIQSGDVTVVELSPTRVLPPERGSSLVFRRARVGVAHLRGRVSVRAAGSGDDALANLSVTAEAAGRRFAARIGADGSFAVHLPAGRYDVVASADDLVGVVADVVAEADVERAVDVVLGPGAHIRGRLRGATRDAVDIAALSGGRLVARDEGDGAGGNEESDEDDTFDVGGLIAGRGYDVVLKGDSVRPVTLHGIVAPADGLVVELRALPIVRGAVGFPRGDVCPITSVSLRVPGRPAREPDADDELVFDPEQNVTPDCRFELTAPAEADAVLVVATGDGWNLEETVTLPSDGDPAPICMNPPCRPDPLEGSARLRVAVVAPPGQRLGRVSLHGERELLANLGCTPAGGECVINALPTGETVTLAYRAAGCEAAPHTLVLTPGENVVSLDCRAERTIEGVVRGAAGAMPDVVTVKCGSATQVLHKRHLFRITCAAEIADVEYRVGAGGAWARVPIPVGATPDTPPLVEISL